MFLNDFYHMLDPVAFTIGPFAVRWYGIAYLIGFIVGGYLLMRYARRWKLELSSDDALNVVTGICLGAVVGGRLGYVLFYGGGYYLSHPMSIFAVNEGGMSFQLKGSIKPSGSKTTLTFTSSNPDVATVSAGGLITTVLSGVCADRDQPAYIAKLYNSFLERRKEKEAQKEDEAE